MQSISLNTFAVNSTIFYMLMSIHNQTYNNIEMQVNIVCKHSIFTLGDQLVYSTPQNRLLRNIINGL